MWKRFLEWRRRRNEKRIAERKRNLQILLALYPDDDPFIVSMLLSPMWQIRLSAVKALDKGAELRREEARLRRIIREELGPKPDADDAAPLQ